MKFRNQVLLSSAAIVLLTLIMLLKNNSSVNLVTGKGSGFVSLSPSITKAIIDLGGEGMLRGVTSPEYLGIQKIESVGSYISPDPEKIIRLRPGAVFISEEDLYIQKISLLRDFGVTVAVIGKNTGFDSMCSNYLKIARLIGKEKTAIEKIESYKKRISAAALNENHPRIVFLVSVKPLVTVSSGSHISSIISDAGADNIFSKVRTPYPILSVESLVLSNPDAVIVMNRGDDEYLYSILSGFKKPVFISKRNIFIAGDEHIPYYTPADYTVAVEKIASILKMIN